MEWDKQQAQPPNTAAGTEELNGVVGNNGGMFVKVMTDEQMEVLRKQIAVYATICEQLVDMHKSLTSHHDLAAGTVMGPLESHGSSSKLTFCQQHLPIKQRDAVENNDDY